MVSASFIHLSPIKIFYTIKFGLSDGAIMTLLLSQRNLLEEIMAGLGWPEILGILAIIILIFGVGRIRRLGGELGAGIRSFREGLQGDDEEAETITESDEPKAEDLS